MKQRNICVRKSTHEWDAPTIKAQTPTFSNPFHFLQIRPWSESTPACINKEQKQQLLLPRESSTTLVKITSPFLSGSVLFVACNERDFSGCCMEFLETKTETIDTSSGVREMPEYILTEAASEKSKPYITISCCFFFFFWGGGGGVVVVVFNIILKVDLNRINRTGAVARSEIAYIYIMLFQTFRYSHRYICRGKSVRLYSCYK